MEPLLTLDGAANFLVTSDLLLDHMTIECSPEGSNRHAPEIDVHKYFCDYIQEAAVRTVDGDTSKNSLSTLYKFITGTKRVTPLGLEKNIAIKFKHECKPGCHCRPTAATCDPSITFPIHFENAKDFEVIMDSALEESTGFGFV